MSTDGDERNALEYLELLKRHIFKGDHILFPMGDRVMNAQDQELLCRRFCEVGCRSFGGQRREELQRVADELEEQWLH